MLQLVVHKQVFLEQLYILVCTTKFVNILLHESPRSKPGVPGFEKVRGILADLYTRTRQNCQKVLSRELARMELA